MERRDFLKVAALSGAAIAVPGIDAVAGRRGSVGQEPDMQDKPVTDFKFRPDGKFKILQFTDTHYVSGDKRSERAMANVLQMLDVEKLPAKTSFRFRKLFKEEFTYKFFLNFW